MRLRGQTAVTVVAIVAIIVGIVLVARHNEQNSTASTPPAPQPAAATPVPPPTQGPARRSTVSPTTTTLSTAALVPLAPLTPAERVCGAVVGADLGRWAATKTADPTGFNRTMDSCSEFLFPLGSLCLSATDDADLMRKIEGLVVLDVIPIDAVGEVASWCLLLDAMTSE